MIRTYRIAVLETKKWPGRPSAEMFDLEVHTTQGPRDAALRAVRRSGKKGYLVVLTMTAKNHKLLEAGDDTVEVHRLYLAAGVRGTTFLKGDHQLH